MLELLRIEWLKLKNYRTFWILLALFVVSIFGINYIVFEIQKQIFTEQNKAMATMVIGSIPYDFPTVWQATANVSGHLLFIPGLLIIIFATNEYSFKTHRQNIIDGWSRRQFISVKIAQAFLMALFGTLIVIPTALFFGLQGKEGISFENFKYIGYFFMMASNYIMVALLFAILFRRGALAIGVFFVYAVILDQVIAMLLNHYVHETGVYMPLESSDKLIPFPAFQALQRKALTPVNETVQFILSLAYLSVYVFFIVKKFEKDDL